MMGVSGDVAIKGRASGSSHGLSALIPRGRNGRWLWFPIELLFREDPVGRFGQMAGDGPDRLLVAFAPGDALVEASAVAVRRPAAIEADGGRWGGGCPRGPTWGSGWRRGGTGRSASSPRWRGRGASCPHRRLASRRWGSVRRRRPRGRSPRRA